LEGLEGRELLSVAKPTGHITAEVHRTIVPGPASPITQVVGRVSGIAASDPLYGGKPAGFLGFSGHGTAGPFGNVLFGTQSQATQTGTTAGTADITDGSAVFISFRGGNQLRVNFTGSSTATGPNRATVSLVGTVASGTGRFLGATGTFQATGTVQLGFSGRLALKYTITFNPAV
jgi:hypothetical protein